MGKKELIYDSETPTANFKARDWLYILNNATNDYFVHHPEYDRLGKADFSHKIDVVEKIKKILAMAENDNQSEIDISGIPTSLRSIVKEAIDKLQKK